MFIYNNELGAKLTTDTGTFSDWLIFTIVSRFSDWLIFTIVSRFSDWLIFTIVWQSIVGGTSMKLILLEYFMECVCLFVFINCLFVVSWDDN